jgi:hypothetical protein
MSTHIQQQAFDHASSRRNGLVLKAIALAGAVALPIGTALLQQRLGLHVDPISGAAAIALAAALIIVLALWRFQDQLRLRSAELRLHQLNVDASSTIARIRELGEGLDEVTPDGEPDAGGP